ncbi:TAF5-like RNA polymerase II p300/CBP-associated factor-associated factor 65 kDa subunit 5L [Heterocephalus glaber]|uniref:TAF5-like RNA polymerase II p300/CBP-associated factor-associated factor 65 kDa subunit 5L n=1 Tax=Heterocephalus glaber TaxID=10181 RepID=G5BZJ8_HETGA|nr:TAF5-like RNA polymerase II p300/CBP-associated factor-associated factor 65 kDa subunit 5L [Heterocephalus glaber]
MPRHQQCGPTGLSQRLMWKRHTQDANQKDAIEQLQTTQTIHDILSNFKLRVLLENKYVVHLQEGSYNYLIRYLQSDNTALCKVLTLHIHLDVQPAKRTDYQLYASGGSSRSESSDLEPPDVPSPILQDEATLEVLQESIKQVKDAPLYHHLLLCLLQHGAAAKHCRNCPR